MRPELDTVTEGLPCGIGEKERTLELIRKYRRYKSERHRIRARNDVYELMRTKVVGYVKGVLARWHRYEDETELLSLSWDAFLFCLDRYVDEKYDIYGHFNTYCRYFLLLHYEGKDKGMDREVYLEDVKDVISLRTDDPSDAIGKLIELKAFRDSLVQEHQRRIFDHVVLGEEPELFANLKGERGGIPCYQYYKGFGTKTAFKSIIEYILGREGKK